MKACGNLADWLVAVCLIWIVELYLLSAFAIYVTEFDYTPILILLLFLALTASFLLSQRWSKFPRWQKLVMAEVAFCLFVISLNQFSRVFLSGGN